MDDMELRVRCLEMAPDHLPPSERVVAAAELYAFVKGFAAPSYSQGADSGTASAPWLGSGPASQSEADDCA